MARLLYCQSSFFNHKRFVHIVHIQSSIECFSTCITYIHNILKTTNYYLLHISLSLINKCLLMMHAVIMSIGISCHTSTPRECCWLCVKWRAASASSNSPKHLPFHSQPEQHPYFSRALGRQQNAFMGKLILPHNHKTYSHALWPDSSLMLSGLN